MQATTQVTSKDEMQSGTDKKIIPGGSFLIETHTASELFTPEELTDEHRMIGETTRKFIDNEVQPHVERLEAHDWNLARELLVKAAELGLLGANIPEEYGGLGLDQISGAVIAEGLGRSASFAVTFGSHTGIGALPILYFGSEEIKQKYLPKIVSGELIAAYALTEAGSG
ncbi:MAG: acyl-CoA dehydrogenase family protein, partial [Pyrinomonadaceae bacterium]